MAVSLHIECCAKRILSPNRIGPQVSNIHQESTGKQTMKVSPSPVPISSATYQKNMMGLYFLRKKSSFISVKHIMPGMQNVVSSVKNVKNSLNNFKDKRGPRLKRETVSNIISALHIDNPRRKVKNGNSEGMQSRSLEETISNSNTDFKVISDGSKDNSPESEVINPLQYELKKGDINIDREWHDLHHAMNSKYQTVSAFCNDEHSKEKFTDIATSHMPLKDQKMDLTPRQAFTGQMVKTNEVPGLLQRIYANLPNVDIRNRLPTRKDIKSKKPVVSNKQKALSRAAVKSHTRILTKSLKTARSNISRLTRLEDLSQHLLEYPEAKVAAIQEDVIPILLMLRHSSDMTTKEQACEVLAQLGHVDPVKGRGVRILTLDGGGTRGLISIRLLQELERKCQKNIYEMFDYICGVSTGSLIATMIGVHKVPLDKCEEIYKEFSKKIFDRTRAAGAMNLATSHAYYNALVWEEILKSEIGDLSFYETARDTSCPKLSAVSAVVNVEKIQNYLFRNYEYPMGTDSNYVGSMQHKLWHGIKASSAAPGYFAECKFGDYIHQDGGLLTNNPTAIAIHESQLLWPQVPLQCVVSVGTGRYEPTTGHYRDPNLSGLRDKLLKIVQSATDTEAVHSTMLDLWPSCYFRLNPYIYEDFLLDETREDRWDLMYKYADDYCKNNQPKFQAAADILQKRKSSHQKVKDWLYLKSVLHSKTKVLSH